MAKPFVKRDTFLPFSRPTIRQVEIDEVVDTLRSGWITTGPKAERFEKDFAAYVGAPEVLAVSSATGGLHIGLIALGAQARRRGDHHPDDLGRHLQHGGGAGRHDGVRGDRSRHPADRPGGGRGGGHRRGRWG